MIKLVRIDKDISTIPFSKKLIEHAKKIFKGKESLKSYLFKNVRL